MNLPNYFLADLPPEATLAPAMISDACRALKSNRERYLAHRSTQHLVDVLTGVAEGWLNPTSPFRKLALTQGPAATRFSSGTLTRGIDSFFQQLTRENLLALVEQDLGHTRRLEETVAGVVEQKTDRASIATGPEFMVHIAAGNVPNPVLFSIVLGILTRSAQFVKCATGASFLPRLFAHSLYEADPKLAACLEIAEWKGGNTGLETELFQEADCVTATGSDETLRALRAVIPPKTRFLGYGQRVSFAFVTAAVLSGLNGGKVVVRAASDVAAWNQLGCLSPHVIYVERGAALSPEQFCELLAQELEKVEATEPRSELPVEIAAAISARRSMLQTRAAFARSGRADPDYPVTNLWASKDSTAWTVVYETDPQFQLSCGNRFIYVKPVTDLAEALRSAESVRGKVSTVGLAAGEDQAQQLATKLGRWGVTRVCPLGRMQQPPLTWRHDGRPPLGDLITWTDWEM
jgi:hypothetical protein